MQAIIYITKDNTSPQTCLTLNTTKTKVVHLAENVSMKHNSQAKTKLTSRLQDSSMRVNNTEPKLCK